MCNPDISIYTHVWIPGYRKPYVPISTAPVNPVYISMCEKLQLLTFLLYRWPNFDVEHECVNWDILNGWAKKNSFDMFTPNLLIHPELGTPLVFFLVLPPSIPSLLFPRSWSSKENG
jgi:hypothetical protein